MFLHNSKPTAVTFSIRTSDRPAFHMVFVLETGVSCGRASLKQWICILDNYIRHPLNTHCQTEHNPSAINDDYALYKMK